MGDFFRSIGNFFKRIGEAFAAFFRTLFGTNDPQTNAPASPTSQPAASTQPAQETETFTAVKRDGKHYRKMQGEIERALTYAYQHDGAKAQTLDTFERSGHQQFENRWAAEKADDDMFGEVSYKGSPTNPREQYRNGKWSKEALPAYLEHNPTHKEAVDARRDQQSFWRQVNQYYESGGMHDTKLSQLAVNPVNDISIDEVFQQNQQGLRINTPANGRINIKAVDADHVAITVRPISDNPKDKYNFAPVTLPYVHKDVIRENYVLVNPAKEGRTEIYVKAGTFDKEPIIGVLEGGKDVAGKNIRTAVAKDDDVVIQESVAALSHYELPPRTNKRDFSGAVMPINVDHSDWRDEQGAAFDLAQTSRANGYYDRSTTIIGFGGGNRVNNIETVSLPSGIPNNTIGQTRGQPFGQGGKRTGK